MANTLTALNKESWEKEVQMLLNKRLVALRIAENISVKDGDTIHKPYFAGLYPQSYTKGSDLTILDLATTDESYNIDKYEAVAGYVDKVDAIQNSHDARKIYTDEMVTDLKTRIDGNILAEYSNANSTVDAGDVGGSSGTAIALSTGNVVKTFMQAAKYLDNLEVSEEERFAILSPSFIALLEEMVAGKDTSMGDDVTVRGAGFMMNRFGFNIYKSTNLAYTARWTPANQPSDGDYIDINGVRITFETGSIDAAGKVKSETSVEVTLNNLVAFLNAPSTSVSGQYMALSQEDVRKLKNLVATDGTTYLGLTVKGGGEITVAASETNDPWSVRTMHNLFGQRGATQLGMQLQPSIGFNQEPKRPLGSGNLVALDIYGYKTWLRNKDKLVDVQIDASNY